MRAVTNSDYRAHTAPLVSKQKILDIFQINTLNIAKYLFRYHNNLLPPLFLNLFMTNSQVHRYDTRTAGRKLSRAFLSHEHQEIHKSLTRT